jgi:hypothetical protein
MDGHPFLDWIGWKPDSQCRQFIKLLTYVGPEGTHDGMESSGVKAPCATADGVEWGTCEILLPDKGRIARAGPTIDLTENNRRLCDSQPVYMKNGEPIQDEIMWSVTLAGMTLRQDLLRMIITGNLAVSYQFDGLRRLVNTGYKNATDGRRCSAMDSIVVNWANHPMTYALNGTHVFVDYLIDAIRRIRYRAAQSPMGSIAVGDQVLLLPSFTADCLLDAFTCWSVCPGAQYNEANLNTLEARSFRNSLNGGLYGMGQIFVDGVPVPMIRYDWMPIGQAAPYFTSDVFVLTRRIGNVPTFWGQYIPMNDPAVRFQEESGVGHYRAIDGGKFLAYWVTQNECVRVTTLMRPNLYMSAPWACARFQNVACMRPLQPLSMDPTSDYYAEEYLSPATCPEDYLVGAFGDER